MQRCLVKGSRGRSPGRVIENCEVCFVISATRKPASALFDPVFRRLGPFFRDRVSLSAGEAARRLSAGVWHVICSAITDELVARVPHPGMAGPRAAACTGEIRAGHGGIESRETSVARIWQYSGLCQFQSFGCVELAMDALSSQPKTEAVATPLFCEQSIGQSAEITIVYSDGRPI